MITLELILTEFKDVFLAILGWIGVYFGLKKRIAEANNEVTKKSRIITDMERIIADKELKIAEKDRCLVESEVLGIDVKKARIELRIAQYRVQDKLAEENHKYKDAQQVLAHALNSLTAKCADSKDASLERDCAIRALTQNVIDAFSKYLDKATLEYKEQSAEAISSYIRSEIIPFILELVNVIDVLNSGPVLNFCANSCAKVSISLASLGSVERALMVLLPCLPEEHSQHVRAIARKEGVIGYYDCVDILLG